MSVDDAVEDQVAFLSGYCEVCVSTDDLATAVVVLKAGEAIAINEEGPEAQLRYMIARVGYAETCRTLCVLTDDDADKLIRHFTDREEH